jgi:hypothetical protein
MNGKPIQKGKEDFFLVNWKDDMEEIHNLARDPNLKDTLERLSTMLDDHISNSLEPPEEQVFLSQ